MVQQLLSRPISSEQGHDAKHEDQDYPHRDGDPIFERLFDQFHDMALMDFLDDIYLGVWLQAFITLHDHPISRFDLFALEMNRNQIFF